MSLAPQHITAMNLIPMPRGSGQRLNVPLLVGVELANTLWQFLPKINSFLGIGYRDDMPDLVYGTGVVV